MGGGLGLVAACDIAVAASDAIFAASEVRLGLIPSTIAPYVLRAIGPRQARRLFQTGERIDAAQAQRIGLVHEMAEPETTGWQGSIDHRGSARRWPRCAERRQEPDRSPNQSTHHPGTHRRDCGPYRGHPIGSGSDRRLERFSRKAAAGLGARKMNAGRSSTQF